MKAPAEPRRGWGRDLADPRWIKAKGLLFVVSGCLAAAQLLVEHPSLLDAALLAICVWSFCRAY